jgi:hypothetical protein
MGKIVHLELGVNLVSYPMHGAHSAVGKAEIGLKDEGLRHKDSF